MREQWKDVPGWERLYEVSDWGRVRSIPRLGVKGKQAGRVYGGNLLSPVKKRGTGYLCVTLRKHGAFWQESVNRLVLMAFVGPALDRQACHKNGVRTDNRLENLYWGTIAENQADKVRHGNSLQGEKNHHHKLSEEQVRVIKASDKKQLELAREFGVSQVLISRIRRGKAWTHVR